MKLQKKEPMIMVYSFIGLHRSSKDILS